MPAVAAIACGTPRCSWWGQTPKFRDILRLGRRWPNHVVRKSLFGHLRPGGVLMGRLLGADRWRLGILWNLIAGANASGGILASPWSALSWNLSRPTTFVQKMAMPCACFAPSACRANAPTPDIRELFVGLFVHSSPRAGLHACGFLVSHCWYVESIAASTLVV